MGFTGQVTDDGSGAARRQQRSDGAVILRGTVLAPGGSVPDGVVIAQGGAIRFVGGVREALRGPWAESVSLSGEPAPGTLVLPGLVDLHNHGGGGASFPDAEDSEAARVAVDEHRRHGTTSLVASLVTASPADLRRGVCALAPLAAAGELAGLHLEGPFLAASRCGAQEPSLMREPDAELTRELAELAQGSVVTMTIAPELQGAVGPGGVLGALVDEGAVPSFGHTDASDSQMRTAIDEAVRLLSAPWARSARPSVTHLFNGMRGLHHREPGPIPPLLRAAAEGLVVLELVADGVHLAPSLVADVVALVGSENVAFVTDAMAAAGMPDGDYRLGAHGVVVSGGVARVGADGSLAGGTAHLLDVVRVSVEGGVPLVDAMRSASATPATVIGDPRIGALAPGMRADVLVTDASLRPRRVFRAGELVHAW